MKQGRFITFEGGEGSGKSTQIKLLSDRLQEEGISCVITREPGGTPAAESIRELLVTGSVDKFSAQTEALLNYAARSEHLRKVIQPALKQGKWVLCDRFNDSTFAYQGGEVDLGFLESLDAAIVGDRQPDLTFVLDIDPELGLERAGKRFEELNTQQSEDRFENKGIEYHRQIRDRFLKRAEQNHKRYQVIDASQTLQEISRIIHKKLLK